LAEWRLMSPHGWNDPTGNDTVMEEGV